MTLDTIFRIASMTKAMTSVAAMQLVEAGKLDARRADRPGPAGTRRRRRCWPGSMRAGKPRLRPAKRPITLRHLLTHTAGFGYEMLSNDLIRYIKRTGTPSTSTGKLASLRLPLLFDPGERWEYGINIDWVGRAVEAASGQPLDAYFREHIFAPLGMTDTGFVLSPEQQPRLVTGAPAPGGRIAGADHGRDMPPQQPEFWAGGGGLYSTGARLSGVSADAAAIRAASAAPACCGRKPWRRWPQPDRRPRCRDYADGDARADQRLRFVSRHARANGGWAR